LGDSWLHPNEARCQHMQHWILSRPCCSRLNWILIIYFIFFPGLLCCFHIYISLICWVLKNTNKSI
jgi:hypothetical protein